jgi:serine phosphatase RsbU (regulator of sigma subunit)/pSer/pThr/pTyr-binding forkhead associated (FHA) protein
MASLLIEKGLNQGQHMQLSEEKTILGRNPDCQVVIPVTSVSREHAAIFRMGSGFHIEDLQSRNGTFVNDEAIAARTKLKNGDKIRICDFQATFTEQLEHGATVDEDADEDVEEPPSSTTIEAKLSHSSSVRLETQPAEKLTALLEITNNLSKTLKLDPLLPKIGENLFQLFRQADRCFIILAEDTGKEGQPRLLPKLVKARRPQDETNARFSKTIVRACIDTAEAVLLDDAGSQMPTSQSVVDFRIRSVMCTPLVATDGKAFGVIQLDTQDRSKKFTQEDLRLLWGVARQASIAMENARLHETSLQQELTRRDLELARKVQLSFMPKNVPVVEGYEFFAFYEPAKEVGGDYYNFIPIGGGRLAMLLGDVAGKGVPAALMVAKLASDARFCLAFEQDTAVAITNINAAIFENASETDRFVTLSAAVLDPTSHVVTLVSAGHPSPLWYHKATGALEECVPKKMAGLPLGIMETCEYASCQVQLEPGDCLLIYSDGVPDSRNLKDQELTFNGMKAALKAGGPHTPKTLGERLVRAVHQHAAGRSPHDDVTLVCFGRK